VVLRFTFAFYLFPFAFLLPSRRFQRIKALLQNFGTATGVNREDESEGCQQDSRSDDRPTLALARSDSGARLALPSILERIQKALLLFFDRLLPQFGEPLLVKLVKNVIAHKSREKVKVKR
jgi:hypothetical protein